MSDKGSGEGTPVSRKARLGKFIVDVLVVVALVIIFAYLVYWIFQLPWGM